MHIVRETMANQGKAQRQHTPKTTYQLLLSMDAQVQLLVTDKIGSAVNTNHTIMSGHRHQSEELTIQLRTKNTSYCYHLKQGKNN
jgi:hypothetical protein